MYTLAKILWIVALGKTELGMQYTLLSSGKRRIELKGNIYIYLHENILTISINSGVFSLFHSLKLLIN